LNDPSPDKNENGYFHRSEMTVLQGDTPTRENSRVICPMPYKEFPQAELEFLTKVLGLKKELSGARQDYQ
jgi:hypothetical protein